MDKLSAFVLNSASSIKDIIKLLICVGDFGIANSQFQRMHKNKPVTTTTIDRLCEILDCRIEDIIEYHPRSK